MTWARVRTEVWATSNLSPASLMALPAATASALPKNRFNCVILENYEVGDGLNIS